MTWESGERERRADPGVRDPGKCNAGRESGGTVAAKPGQPVRVRLVGEEEQAGSCSPGWGWGEVAWVFSAKWKSAFPSTLWIYTVSQLLAELNLFIVYFCYLTVVRAGLGRILTIDKMCEVFVSLKIPCDKLAAWSLNLGQELVFKMSQTSCKFRNCLNENKSLSVVQHSAIVAAFNLPLGQFYCQPQPLCLFIDDDKSLGFRSLK